MNGQRGQVAETPVALEGAQKAPRFYRPELDALRFFAFLCVFVTHADPPSFSGGGWGKLSNACWLVRDTGAFGVCIFFFLSAYLITELLQRERGATGSIHLVSFYKRRILRIWPLYFGFLFVGALISRIGPHYWIGWPRMLAFILLAGNWYSSFQGYGGNPIAPLWSISLEEQFYLLWPAVAKRGGGKGLAALCVLIVFLSFGALFYLGAKGDQMDATIWTNSFVQFVFFAAGGLLALALHGRTISMPIILRPLLFAAGISVCLVANHAFHLKGLRYRPDPPALCIGFFVMVLGCATIFLSILGTPSRFLPRPVLYLGKISYGLYVFHLLYIEIAHNLLREAPLLFLWRALLAMLLTIVTATLSYEYFEKFFLRLKQRFEFVRSRAA